uniref:hypothetical protein n=1 Tax=Bradyrhizobium sp. (strain ORS 278) TaxID=114615 RepID=UPI0005A1BD85|nr:hypothetical protein [Bradyrhizobium sp. ORS 278]
MTINFEYDLDEIVQMAGKPITLAGALRRMPDQVGPLAVLYRDAGKQPALFDAEQIQDLLDKHRSELEAGNPQGHREADKYDN